MEEKKNSGMPLIIIVGVLAIAVVGAYFLYNRSATTKTTANNGAKPSPAASVNNNYSQAPPGANPPNILGSPTAAVTVEEFADFQCPSCGDKFPVFKQVQSVYGSRIRFIFRNFPLQMHDKAYDAAVAAEAAGLQGKFWDMENQLYTSQKSWSSDPNYRQVWEGYAQKIGLDVEKYKNDMAGLITKNRVGDDMKRGQVLGVNSTPTVYVNGKSVPYEQMTLDGLRQLIDAELQAASGANRPAANTTANAAAANANQN